MQCEETPPHQKCFAFYTQSREGAKDEKNCKKDAI